MLKLPQEKILPDQNNPNIKGASSVGKLAVKGKPERMLCCLGQKTWEQGTQKRLQISIPSFPQSSLSKSAFSLSDLYALWQSLEEMNIANSRGRLSQRLRKQIHQHKHGDMYKSLGWDGMDPRVVRGLADVIARPRFIIFERLWQLDEVPNDKKKGKCRTHLQERHERRSFLARNLPAGQFTLSSIHEASFGGLCPAYGRESSRVPEL